MPELSESGVGLDIPDDSDAESMDFCLEITGENLEDLLAYDDLFLDYFNAFLALPVFPQALVYNRLTGAFEEVEEGAEGDGAPLPPGPLHYGATDSERDNLLEWARHERLPFFLKTQLFRELKLVKLLLRPLEDRQSASRGSSRNIRGYSRQTETYVSSLSNSADNSAPDVLDDDDLWADLNYSALYRYRRPGSRALSVPIKCIHEDSYEEEEDDEEYYHQSLKSREAASSKVRQSSVTKNTAGKRASAEKRATRISSKVEVIRLGSKSGKTRSSQATREAPASSTEELFKRGARALSAPVTYAHFRNMHRVGMPDFDAMFGEEEPEVTGQTYVTFEDDHVSDEQTETDVRNLEGRFQMSLQQVKEHMLSSRSGFERYREFLRGTSGSALLDFWLDCEDFKDTMEEFDENKQREIASMLFRDIQDKYKLRLTQDAKEQITRSASNVGVGHTIFLRTQYDVLRRLRAYWLPRFLTHCERTATIHMDRQVAESTTTRHLKPPRLARQHSALFPTISLVHSMPMLPEQAKDYQFTKSGSSKSRGLVARSTSSLYSKPSANKVSSRASWFARRTHTSASLSTYSRQTAMSRSTKDRFLLALAHDRIAGGPFLRYLSQRLGDQQLLSCLLFWQDVTEYGATEDRSADRLLRLCHAWTIYNHYLAHDSPHTVEISEKERLNLHRTLQSAPDFIEASIFDTAKAQAVSRLEKAWVRFLKEDLKAFLDCRVRVGGESPPSTAEAIEITVTDQDVLIKRPRPWVRRVPGSAASERARRLQRALILAEDIDDERRAERRQEARERRREMERERKKAIRNAYARQRDAKKKGGPASAGGEEGMEGEEEAALSYQELSSNKQVMTMFRKYLAEEEGGKDVQNQIQLLQELDTYFNVKDGKQKKEAMAAHIFKTYLEPQSKRFTETSDVVLQRLESEGERPSSATLREVQTLLMPSVEETFREFLSKQSEELGVNPGDLASMSQVELAMRMGTDQSLYTGWQKGKGRNKTTGRAQPSREDKNEFLHTLNQCTAGKPTLPMLYFYKYLLKHAEDDAMPQLDKDLFFYIEVQKFKECSHAHSDEEMMKRKMQSMVDCFLDSVYSPALQIDISGDMQARVMKAAQRYLGGKDVQPSLFDDAQYLVFKELLPYWAGFRRSQHIPAEPKKRPVTKYEKMLKRRLENIQNYQMPSNDFHLPRIPEGAVPSYSISLADGVKFREEEPSEDAEAAPVPEIKETRTNRLAAGPSVDNLARRSRRTSAAFKDAVPAR